LQQADVTELTSSRPAAATISPAPLLPLLAPKHLALPCRADRRACRRQRSSRFSRSIRFPRSPCSCLMR